MVRVLHGEPYTTCQRSGEIVPYKDTVIEWTGLRVSKKYVDQRNPQDFPKPARPYTAPPGQYIDEYFPSQEVYNDYILDDLGNVLMDDSGGYLIADLPVANLVIL